LVYIPISIIIFKPYDFKPQKTYLTLKTIKKPFQKGSAYLETTTRARFQTNFLTSFPLSNTQFEIYLSEYISKDI
jgi:hypothetical protein